jgi:hypothetical protein
VIVVNLEAVIGDRMLAIDSGPEVRERPGFRR